MKKSPLFTDFYEFTMASAYYEYHKRDDQAVFELFFRKCPFGGEFAIVAGHNEIKEGLLNYAFSIEEINYLKKLPVFSHTNPDFFTYLKNMNLEDVEIFGPPEGSIVFANEPLLQVKGPLIKVQLLESMLLNHINFATLIATLARRMWLAAKGKTLIEFGMRRAQGPNGALTATRSSFIGGFSSSSNTEAGLKYNIPVVGTMAHSFVQSFTDLDSDILNWNGINIGPLLSHLIKEDGFKTHPGELAAFLAFAKMFPNSATLLVDTYNSLESGIPNALRVFKILKALGHSPFGIRLDSGDMNLISKKARKIFDDEGMKEIKILSSNEIDEKIIMTHNEQGSPINAYGIGTRLVTASADPSLGGVYKLVELNGLPKIKISDQPDKKTIPLAKKIYRICNRQGQYLRDIMTAFDENPPMVIEEKIQELLIPLFVKGKWLEELDLNKIRERSLKEMAFLDSKITAPVGPIRYEVIISDYLKKITASAYQLALE